LLLDDSDLIENGGNFALSTDPALRGVIARVDSNISSPSASAVPVYPVVGELGPLPFDDLFARADGDPGEPWHSSASWAIVGGKLVCTPTYGGEKIVNGGFDADTDWDHPAGSSISGGLLKYAAVAAYGGAKTTVNPGWSKNKWYKFEWDIANWSVGTCGIGDGVDYPVSVGYGSTGDGHRRFVMPELNNPLYLRLVTGVIGTYDWDNLSMMEIDLASMLLGMTPSVPNVRIMSYWSVAVGRPAGVCLNLDDEDNPQNLVVGYHDRLLAGLYKCVGGVWTSLIKTFVTYVDGAAIEVRKSGTTYQLFYNGTQVGTNQTIADVGIINNSLHGLFSSDAGNQCSGFGIAAMSGVTTVNVNFLGTSITYNYDVTETQCFRNLASAWLRYYLGASYLINSSNQGNPSAASFFMLAEYAARVTAIAPTLLVFDCEPNDNTALNDYCCEAILRKVRTDFPDCKVVGILFGRVNNYLVDDPTNVMETLYGTATKRIALLTHYGAAYVDYAALLVANVPAVHPLSWYFVDDNVHPSVNGHAAAAALLEPALPPITPDGWGTTLPARIYADTVDAERAPSSKVGTDYDSTTGTWTTDGDSIKSVDVATPATVTYSGAFRFWDLYLDTGASQTIQYQIDGGDWHALTSNKKGNDAGVYAAHTLVIKVVASTRISGIYMI
jgi:hypothetical protein